MFASLVSYEHMNTRTHAHIEAFRARLLTERDTLDEDLMQHGSRKNGDWQGSIHGVSGGEADPTDAADNIEELMINVPLVEELEMRRGDVNDALKKIENGTYGVCEVGGEPIATERLEANPAARTCVAHA